MAQKSMFWDNYGSDIRNYTSDDYAQIFAQIIGTNTDFSRIGTGVGRYNATSSTDGLLVSANGLNMTTTVAAGFAFIAGKGYTNTSNLQLTHEIAHPTLLRYDRVILRYDASSNVRNIYATIKKGVAATSPVPPSMQNDDVIKEIALATVRIEPNRAYINNSNVTDKRPDTEVCGYLPLHNIYRGMNVSAEGIVSMPNQSYVEAKRDYAVGVVPVTKHPTFRAMDIHPAVVDRQGEVTSDNRFTAKTAGIYSVYGYFRCDNFLFSGSEYIDFQAFVRKNGVSGEESRMICARATNINSDNIFSGTTMVELAAGDTIMIDITYFGTVSFEPSLLNHRVTITKVT